MKYFPFFRAHCAIIVSFSFWEWNGMYEVIKHEVIISYHTQIESFQIFLHFDNESSEWIDTEALYWRKVSNNF